MIPEGGQYIKIAISKIRKTYRKNAQLTIDDVVFTSTADAKTYTYTWSVNGEKTKNILNEGDKVEAPKPASIGGKEFTGWVTTSTVDANKNLSMRKLTQLQLPTEHITQCLQQKLRMEAKMGKESRL